MMTGSSGVGEQGQRQGQPMWLHTGEGAKSAGGRGGFVDASGQSTLERLERLLQANLAATQ
jgi:hypothetical protein